MKTEEFDAALSLLIDNEIPPELFQDLQDHLLESEEAQWQYLHHMETHVVLSLEAGLTSMRKDPATIIPMERIIARQKRKVLRFAMMASAAVILIAGLIAALVLLPQAEVPLAHIKGSTFAQFELTHGVSDDGEVRWAGDELGRGSRLTLTCGSVELKLRSGVYGIVRAPADLILDREDLVVLRYGTAWFEVPKEAVGFQVDTPEFLVTDLGTEFGVISTVEDPDEVHVLNGQVKVKNHRGVGEEALLAKGDARIAGADGLWNETKFDAKAFLYSVPTDRSLPPYLHWSFDHADERQLKVEGTHRDRSRITASAERGTLRTVKGRVGQAIAFDGGGAQLHTDWPGVSGGNPRTVAFWLKLPSQEGQKEKFCDFTLASWGIFNRGDNSEWAVRVTNCLYVPGDRYTVGDTARIHLFLGSGWFNGTTPLDDGQWHHIAVRYNGVTDRQGRPVVTLFVDGRPEETHYQSENPPQPIRTDIHSGNSRPLRMASSRSGINPPFVGEIDELYIFEGRVEESVIEELAISR